MDSSQSVIKSSSPISKLTLSVPGAEVQRGSDYSLRLLVTLDGTIHDLYRNKGPVVALSRTDKPLYPSPLSEFPQFTTQVPMSRPN